MKTTNTTNTQKKRRFVKKPLFIEMKLERDDLVPEQATRGAAGYDLKALEDGVIQPGKIVPMVRTGCSIALPNRGLAAFITPRSGLAKKGLSIINTPGTIDSDYRGEIMINFINLGSEPIEWKAGERIAQMILVPVVHGKFKVVDDFTVKTERGEGGFGSTGTEPTKTVKDLESETDDESVDVEYDSEESETSDDNDSSENENND